MEKKVTKREVKNVYDLLVNASMASMAGTEKLSLVRLLRVVKPAATAYDNDLQDVVSKLLPANYNERFAKAIAFEKRERENAMTADEYNQFVDELKTYNKAVEDLNNEELELDYEPLTKECLEHLLDGNDWSVEQAILISEYEE